MVGIMWFDDTKGMKLEDKVERAVSYYEEKFEVSPTVVKVHESELEEETQMGDVRVTPVKNVRPNTFFVGVE